MNKKAIILAVLILIIIVCGMFIFGYLTQKEVMAPSADPLGSDAQVEEKPRFSVDTVELKHFYTESVGVHTLVGEFMPPTSCDTIVDSVVLLDDGARALVSFGLMSAGEGAECTPLTAPVPFKTGFLAKKGITIDAVFEGKDITVKLVEAGPDERP